MLPIQSCISLKCLNSVRQIRVQGNLEIIFAYFSAKTLCCDGSLELSGPGGSNEGLQHIFSLEIRKIISELVPKPYLIWSSVDSM